MQNTGYSQVLRSTWFGREDEKTIRSWILSGQLHGEGKTRRRDTASSQVNLILTRRQDFGSCQVNFTMMKRRDTWYRHVDFIRTRPDDVDLKLVFSSFHPHKVDLTRSRILSSCLLVKIKSTRLDPISRLLVFPSSWYGSLKVPPEDEINQEARTRRRDEKKKKKRKKKKRRRDEKTRKWVKKTRRWDEKTKRRDPRSRQVDFVGTRRQKDEIIDLVKSTWLGREDKTRSWISWSWLHEEEKTRRRDTGSRQVDFIRIRRQ